MKFTDSPAPRRTWVVALLLALVLLAIDSAERLYMLRAISALDAFGVAHPAPEVDSPTGYARGQRDVVLPASGMDGYHWIMQTQQMFATGDARIRAVDFDNAPNGREVHWASPLRWYLGALAWLRHLFTDEPLAIAVERAAPVANSLLLAVLLVGLTPLTARRFGAFPAAALALGLVAAYPFFEAFAVGGPDHHGLALACGLMTTLFLAAGGGGWVSANGVASGAPTAWAPEAAAAKRWFLLSGVAGAGGVWISAATMLPVIASLGFSGVIGSIFVGRQNPDAEYNPAPELWRWWGFAGAAATLGFYLIEYFPHHLAWRLEIIHPVYALAWAGGGELACRIIRWRRGTAVGATPRAVAVRALASAAVIAPIIVIAAGRDAVFAIFDPMVSAVPLAEFFALPHVWQRLTWVETIIGISALPLLAIPLMVILRRQVVAAPTTAVVVILLITGVVTFLLGWKQIRWFGISCSVWLAAWVVATQVFTTPGGWRWSRPGKVLALVLAGAIILPYPVWVLKFGVDMLRGAAGVSPKDMELVALRDLARGLSARFGDDPAAIVLAGPDVTTLLCYHGGLRGVGTLYWENRDGVRAAAEIFAAPDAASALELVRQRGITHLIAVSSDVFSREAVRLLEGSRADGGKVREGFIASLLDVRRAPTWLRPVHFPLPEHEYLRQKVFRVYEVAPAQNEVTALTAQAWYLIADGRAAEAIAPLRAAFARDAGNLSVLIALAHAQLRQNDEAGVRRTLAGLRGRIEGIGDFSPADRINLAVLFGLENEHTPAARQIVAVLETADTGMLRRLGVLELVDLVTLARQYDVEDRNPQAVSLARELIPPVIRARAGLGETETR